MLSTHVCKKIFGWLRIARRESLLAAIVLFALVLPAKAQEQTLELALLPTLNVRALLSVYLPLQVYLESELQRPVRLVTAPDYRTYMARTQQQKYRYAITAPHFARLAQQESGYTPVLRVKRDLAAIIVANKGSADSVSGQRGATVSTPDPLAIVSMLGLQLLKGQGLTPGDDVTVVTYPSFASAMLAAASNEVAAAITALPPFAQMPAAMRASLKVIAISPSVPPIMLIARADVPATECEQLKNALLRFAESELGHQFFARTKFESFIELRDGDLSALDPYTEQLKAALAAP